MILEITPLVIPVIFFLNVPASKNRVQISRLMGIKSISFKTPCCHQYMGMRITITMIMYSNISRHTIINEMNLSKSFCQFNLVN